MKKLPERHIDLSHSKTALLLLVALLFVVIGLWLILMPQASLFSTAIGYIGIAFFGACSAVAIKKLMQRGAGLIVSAKGVHDQSSGTSAGFVPWADVRAVQPSFVSGQNLSRTCCTTKTNTRSAAMLCSSDWQNSIFRWWARRSIVLPTH